jgi:hypothetical protein
MAEDSSSQNVDPHLVAEIVRGLCRQKQRRCRSAWGTDCDGASDTERPRHEYDSAHTGAGEIGAGSADPAIGATRPCRVPRMRISRGNPAPAFAGRTRARTGGLSRPLEARDGSPADGTGLFGAPLDDGKTAWAGSQIGRGRHTGTAGATAASASRVKPRLGWRAPAVWRSGNAGPTAVTGLAATPFQVAG